MKSAKQTMIISTKCRCCRMPIQWPGKMSCYYPHGPAPKPTAGVAVFTDATTAVLTARLKALLAPHDGASPSPDDGASDRAKTT